MAMNKSEKARMEALEQQLREAKALRWTDPVTPDIPPPEGGSMRETSGFAALGSLQYGRVEPASSSCVAHGRGYSTRAEQQKAGSSGSQRPIHLFSTKLLALRALRNSMEREAAQRIAIIDKMIEDEIAKDAT